MTTSVSTTPWKMRSASARRSMSCTTTGRVAWWMGSPHCCASAPDAARATPAHPHPRRETRARRARSRRQGRRRRAAGRRDGSDLHRPAPNPGNDRASGDSGGRRCGRPLHPVGRPHDVVSPRPQTARRRRTPGRAADGRRHHSAGRHGRVGGAGDGEIVRPRNADVGSHQVHRSVGGGARRRVSRLKTLSEQYQELRTRLEQGGGADRIKRQHDQGKLTARERVAALLDRDAPWVEIGLLMAWDQYDEQAPAAGVVTGLGRIGGRPVVVVANDATVKAGSWWPETIKKILRAQEIAMRARVPIIYLVDSAGVNLPFHGGVFPGQYGAARILYYNSVLTRYPRVPPEPAVIGARVATDIYDLVPEDHRQPYDARAVLECIIDEGHLDEFQADYAKEMITGHARVGGIQVGVIANSRGLVRKQGQPPKFGGIIYTESAEKVAYFIDVCDRQRTPLLFIQDVSGFMVGAEAEHSGIIRAGARFVEAMATATVPKIVLTVNHASGAGYYAMAGQGFDPDFIFSWPTGRMGVMEGDSAVQALYGAQLDKLKRAGAEPDERLRAEMERVREDYEQQLDARFAAARGYVDAVIAPEETRDALALALRLCLNYAGPHLGQFVLPAALV